MAKKNEQTIVGDITSGGAYNIILLAITFGFLSWLAIWGYNNQNLPAIGNTVIFTGMLFFAIISVVISKSNLLTKGSFSNNSVVFYIGFIVWAIILFFTGGGTGAKSVLSVSENSIFASVSNALPQFLNFSLSTFIIPIAEEFFWMIGITAITLVLVKTLSRQFKIFKTVGAKLVVLWIIGGVTFAFFHTNNIENIAFLISAFVFRGIFATALLLDEEYDLIPFVQWGFSGVVGAHIANNWINYGFLDGLSLLLNNLFPSGIILLGILIMSIVGSLQFIGKLGSDS